MTWLKTCEKPISQKWKTCLLCVSGVKSFLAERHPYLPQTHPCNLSVNLLYNLPVNSPVQSTCKLTCATYLYNLPVQLTCELTCTTYLWTHLYKVNFANLPVQLSCTKSPVQLANFKKQKLTSSAQAKCFCSLYSVNYALCYLCYRLDLILTTWRFPEVDWLWMRMFGHQWGSSGSR